MPPPPGQSRESSIVLDAEGRFWHAGELVEHPGMQQAFATWIRRHPLDGRYVLCNGYDWSYFTVRDVPFFVRGLREEASGLELFLSDQTRELLDPGTLSVGQREAVYCTVKGGSFEGRFMPAAQAALLPHLFEGAAGEPVLRIGAKDHAFATRVTAPAS